MSNLQNDEITQYVPLAFRMAEIIYVVISSDSEKFRKRKSMSKLVAPHGGKGLGCALLEGAARDAELKKAAGLEAD
jgi:hypothetical protein